LTLSAGREIRESPNVSTLVSPQPSKDNQPKEEWIQKENPLMSKVFIRIRLRRPRNDSLGALSGRGAPAASCERARAPHEILHCEFTDSSHRR
jgi:hypothetical protein